MIFYGRKWVENEVKRVNNERHGVKMGKKMNESG